LDRLVVADYDLYRDLQKDIELASKGLNMSGQDLINKIPQLKQLLSNGFITSREFSSRGKYYRWERYEDKLEVTYEVDSEGEVLDVVEVKSPCMDYRIIQSSASVKMQPLLETGYAVLRDFIKINIDKGDIYSVKNLYSLLGAA